jgi:hypothetical protein
MKNILVIDYDSSREVHPVSIGKMGDTPKTRESETETLKFDVEVLTEALIVLIDEGSKVGYINKHNTYEEVITKIKNKLDEQ